jgi:hypothetical protein
VGLIDFILCDYFSIFLNGFDLPLEGEIFDPRGSILVHQYQDRVVSVRCTGDTLVVSQYTSTTIISTTVPLYVRLVPHRICTDSLVHTLVHPT